MRILSHLMGDNLPREVEDSIRRWFALSANSEEKTKALDRIFAAGFKEDPSPDRHVFESYEQIRKILGFAEEKPTVRKIPMRRIAFRVAAVMIPIFVIAGAIFFTQRSNDIPDVYENIAFVIADGAQQEVILPDGSKVWLKPGTRIEYPETFGDRREVTLDGEAYFDVVRDDTKTFSVRTDHLTIRVLGTEFNVAANNQDIHRSVLLNRGRVEVMIGENSYMMEPSDELIYNIPNASVSLNRIAAGHSNDWRQSTLTFDHIPLDDVFSTIEKRYNIPVRRNPSQISDKTILMKLKGYESLEEVLSYLQTITGSFNYEITQDEVIIEVTK